MTNDDWHALIYAIKKQNCILMIGPTLVTGKQNGLEKPMVKILANHLVEKIEDKQKIFDQDDLMQVAQQYRIQKGSNALHAAIESFYESIEEYDAPDTLINLAGLPFYLVINSAPDNFLYDAFKKHSQKECIHKYYHFKGNKVDYEQMGDEKRLLIYNLFGSIIEPESLVLSESGLLDFIVAVTSKNPSLPDNIRSEFTNKDKCFLFLGFGFHNWFLRVIMHVLQGESKESHSFAMEQLDAPNPKFQQTALFYRQNFKINIFEGDLNLFTKELLQRYEKNTKSQAKKDDQKWELPIDAPTVFLCHAHENKTVADDIYKRLSQKGIRPWLDKENLIGGDNWNREIEKSINEIDYMVILQSDIMKNMCESYFFKEIHLALERQNKFRPGVRFIIPALIDNSDPLEELEHLQNINLQNIPDHIENLAKIIKRDFQKRKRC